MSASSITSSYSAFVYDRQGNAVDHAYVKEIPEKGWAALSADDIPTVQKFIAVRSMEDCTPFYAQGPTFMGEKFTFLNNADGVYVLKKGELLVLFTSTAEKTIIAVAPRVEQSQCITQMNALKDQL